MQGKEQSSSVKDFFTPLTKFKAVHLLIIIGLIVFFNSLFNGFVWDDLGQIVNNPTVHSLSNIWTFFFGSHDIHGNLIKVPAIYYRPLMGTVFTLIYVLFGPNAFFFHLFSLILHITLSIFIFLLFSRFFNIKIACISAIIFLIHPLNSEAANYIGALNDLLYMFFGMLGLLLIQREKISFKSILGISICMFFSLISKESGFLFIPVLLSYIYFYHRDYFLQSVVALGSVSLLYFILRSSFYIGMPEDTALGFSPFLHMSFLQHLVNIPAIFSYYIVNFIFPYRLAIAQHWSVGQLSFSAFFIPLIIMCCLIGFNIYLIRRSLKSHKNNSHTVIFFSIWFWIGVGLYFQFIPLDMTVADRWFYFPMIGLLGLLNTFFEAFDWEKLPYKYLLFLIIIYMGFLGLRTMIRNGNWHDEYTLYSHDIKTANHSFDLENQLGIVLYKAGKTDDAMYHLNRSVQLWNCSEALENLGIIYEKKDELRQAEADFSKKLECNPQYKTYGNLTILYYNEGNLQKTKLYAQKGISAYPNAAGLYYLLGLAEYRLGDKDSAVKSLQMGYQLSGDPQIQNSITQVQNNIPVPTKISL